MTADSGYCESFYKVRDVFHKLDKKLSPEFKQAMAKFLRCLSVNHKVGFYAPGPGSVVRWAIFSVHNHLYPGMMELPPSYCLNNPSEEYFESLKELLRTIRSSFA